MPCLDDSLVLVDSAQVFDGGPCNLTICRARNPEKTPLYVLVDNQGVVRVGRADRLGEAISRHLDEFDPSWHGVISVSATSHHRYLGNRLDLWIVVRRASPKISDGRDEHVAYHGLISLDPEGKPQLEPSLDDWEMAGPRRWQAGPIDDRLPELLRCCNFACPSGTEPFEPLPPAATQEVRRLEEELPAAQIEVVTWSKGTLGLALAGEVQVSWGYGTREKLRRKRLELGGWIHALALTDDPPGSVRGVAGPEARLLIGFTEQDDHLDEAWRQSTHEFPVAVACLPASEEPGPDGEWPDLLVAYHDGQLHHLRYVGNGRIREAWATAWHRLGGDTAEQRIDAAQSLVSDNPGWRQAALLGAIEKVLEEAPAVSAEVLNDWVERVSSLFRPMERFRVLSGALVLLLRALESAVRRSPDTWPCDREGAFLTALVHRLYFGQSYLAIRERVDETFRNLPLSEEQGKDELLRELRRRSKISGNTVWKAREPADGNVEKSIRLCTFGLERWANAYVVEDALRLGTRDEVFAGVAGFSLPGPGDGREWVFLARPGAVEAHVLGKDRKLSTAPVTRLELDEERAIQAIVAVPGSDPGRGCQILAAGISGALHLLAFDPGAQVLRAVARRPGSSGSAWSLACTALSGRTMVAMSCNDRRRSTVLLYVLEGERLVQIRPLALDLPRVRAIDLAADGEGGLLLAAGSFHGAPVTIYHLDETGIVRKKRWFRVLKSGALTLRFSSPHRPDTLLAGARSGLLWCADLTVESSVSDLRWTYDLGGAIRAIERVEHGGQPHFLAGAENGKLVLLNAREGGRVWKHGLRYPILQVHGIEGSETGTVLAGMRGAHVAVFSRISDREGTLESVHGYLDRLRRDTLARDEDLWTTATAEPVQAIFRFRRRNESFLEILKRFPARETRARLVRYLVEVIGSAIVREDIRAIVQELSLRELMLLLSCLPDSRRDWDAVLSKELQERLPQRGDNSLRAGMAAVVSWIQRLGRRPSEARFEKLFQPRPEYWDFPWVRLEFARVLLLHAETRAGSEKHRPAQLVGAVLPSLLQLPPTVTEAAADVLRYESEVGQSFSSVRILATDLQRLDAVSSAATLQAVAEVLERAGLAASSLKLLAPVTSLFAVNAQNRSEPWEEWRMEELGHLRRLVQQIGDLRGSEPPLGPLVSRLRSSLLFDPLPEDSASLSDQAAWWLNLSRRLAEPLPEARNPDDHPWATIIQHLVRDSRALLRRIGRLETSYLFSRVRPFLFLREVEVSDGNKVRLLLEAKPEGQKQLGDVSILFTAERDGGLLEPGTRKCLVQAAQYPVPTEVREIELTGYVRPAQQSVLVETELQDGTGYRAKDRWLFPLPKISSQERAGISFQLHLPKAFRGFVQAVVQCRPRLVLAVIDPDLSREGFVEEWLRQAQGRRVRLDDLLHDYGRGRRYSARPLSLDRLERGIQGLDPSERIDPALSEVSPEIADRPILVSPLDETLGRLIDGEVPGLLEAWSSWLKQRAMRKESPQLVLVLASAHAALLRSLGPGEIVELAAHRLLVEEESAKQRHALRQELEELAVKETGLRAERARDDLERLGWDLRLVLRWLRWVREDRLRKGQQVAAFLTEARADEVLRRELRSLQPLDLIHALVGVQAVTYLELKEVVPGHVSAVDLFSSPKKHAPKLLQREGAPFTERSLEALQSTRQTDQLAVQGIGTTGVLDQERSHLLAIATYPRIEQREAGYQRLSRLGIGAYVGRVFRTRSPYRELIRELYKEVSDAELVRKDEVVYAKIMGKERTPLESLSLAELSHLPADSLAKILPRAKPQDLRRLNRLGRFWEPDPQQEQEDVETVLASLFKARQEAFRRLEPVDARWDSLLAALSWPVFGLGKLPGEEAESEEYPEEYFLWSDLDHPVQAANLTAIGQAVEETMQRRQQQSKERNEENAEAASVRRAAPKVTVIGPGAERAPLDETRRVAVLRSTDLCHAAWAGELADGMRRRARAQMRITALSPFQTSGALPPGSPLFVGRERELAYIKSKIHSASLLIIGSRRVGKTSLLNQVDDWARKEVDLAPVFVDLQGCRSAEDFRARLGKAVPPELRARSLHGLEEVAEATRASGRFPVFLLNEIDGLVEHAEDFVASWRGVKDRGAQFVMVGYSAISRIGVPNSPFFHFTDGPRFGERTLVLEALTEEAAGKLLDLLEKSDLQLRWSSPWDKERAYLLCLDRSYRIPWVLQRYGQLLVEHMERERRETLTYQDVEKVVEREGQVVWHYIEGIDYKSLGFKERSSAAQPGFMLVLVAVARKKYFLGGLQAPIRDKGLRDRPALIPELSFTVGEAREVVKATINELLLPGERAMVESWFNALDLEEAFRLLTLTLMLEPDPEDDRRYGFLLHILPRELVRKYGDSDPLLDGLVVRYAAEFMNSIG